MKKIKFIILIGLFILSCTSKEEIKTIEKIEFENNNQEIMVDEKIVIKGNLFYNVGEIEKIENKDIVYSTNDTEIIELNGSEITGKNEGDAVVILTIEGYKKEFKVRINKRPIENEIVSKGDRTIGFDISNYHDTYEKALNDVKEIGVDSVSLHFNWDILEIDQGDYSFFTENYGFIDWYYGDTEVELTLGIIDTNAVLVPKYIKDKNKFSDMIEPYKKVLDMLKLNLPNLNLKLISIGNEIDIYLGDDQVLWEEWIVFYKEISKYCKELFPKTIIGTKSTLYGAFKNVKNVQLLSNHESTNGIFLTYYPLNDDFTVKEISAVDIDFEKMVSNFYKDIEKPIYLLECGFPSSSACNSSQELQKDFLENVFKNWDKYYTEIKGIYFAWHSDLKQGEIDNFEKKYNISDNIFLEYLRSLGFFEITGKKKKVWEQLKIEIENRN